MEDAFGNLTKAMDTIHPKYTELSDGNADIGALRMLATSLTALAKNLLMFADGSVPMEEFDLTGFASGILETALWIKVHTGDILESTPE